MGVDFSKIIDKQSVTLNKIKYKKVGVTTYDHLRKVLKSKDQTKDARSRPNTHITGLFNLAVSLSANKLKPAFILDGRFPEIKKHQKVVNEIPPARVTSSVSAEMIKDIKAMFDMMGIPVVQAPTESSAQAAHMIQKGDLWGVVSRGWDPVMFGADKVLLKAADARLKKIPKKDDYELTGSQMVDLKTIKKSLKLDQDQLIILSMLLGTKFNPGIVDLSQTQALHLVKKWKEFPKLFKYAGWNYSYTWKEVFDCIKTLPVTNKYKLKWEKPRVDKLHHFLVDQHAMSAKKFDNALEKLS